MLSLYLPSTSHPHSPRREWSLRLLPQLSMRPNWQVSTISGSLVYVHINISKVQYVTYSSDKSPWFLPTVDGESLDARGFDHFRQLDSFIFIFQDSIIILVRLLSTPFSFCFPYLILQVTGISRLLTRLVRIALSRSGSVSNAAPIPPCTENFLGHPQFKSTPAISSFLKRNDKEWVDKSCICAYEKDSSLLTRPAQLAVPNQDRLCLVVVSPCPFHQDA